MITETQAANLMIWKTVRACDGCAQRRARWYCAADDAFLCQSCDASVHSANQVASRHNRVPLRTSSSSSSELKTSRTTVRYEGFTRKARTPRNKKSNNSDNNKVDDDVFNSNNHLVPDLGSEEVLTFSLSSSSINENEEKSNHCVPVFDPFSNMDAVKYESVEENSFGFVPNGCNNKREGDHEERMDDGFDGSLPLDADLAEFATDVENLLGEECCVDVKEQLGFLEFKDESIYVNDFDNFNLNGVKNEEEKYEESASRLKSDHRRLGRERENERVDTDEEYCCKDEETLKRNNYNGMFLRLDYEAVITAWDSHGSPWTAGCRQEFSPGDGWPDCMLQGYMCPRHVLSSSKGTTALGSMPRHPQGRHTVSDGRRKARVLRYQEKRRTRLFAKRIRYEVRKLNAEKRPRIKGRFVKRASLLGTH